MVVSASRETELVRALRQHEADKAAKAAAESERQWLSDNFGLDPKEARAIQSTLDRPAPATTGQRLGRKASGQVGKAIEDEAVRSIADLIYLGLALAGITGLALIMFNLIVVGSWIHRAQNSGSIGAHFLGTTLGLNIPFLGDGGWNGDAAVGLTYASPIPSASLQDLIEYKPSHGQSFGPKTGNQRSYGPHAGIDFDCRVGGCAGAPVASPIAGKVSEIRQIGTSANGGSYQVHVVGEDWDGAVEHQLVHVDSIAVSKGDRVTPGQIVARVSPTDSVSTGPHLDWKIMRGGQFIDPQDWARRAIKENDSRDSGPGGVNMTALAESIKSQESGGDHRAINDRTGAAGAWQILPSNISGWSRQCLGSPVSISQFLESMATQQKIVECKLGEYAATHQQFSNSEEMLVRRVAATWYSGNGDLYDNTRPQGPNGKEPSIRDYTVSIWQKYQGLK